MSRLRAGWLVHSQLTDEAQASSHKNVEVLLVRHGARVLLAVAPGVGRPGVSKYYRSSRKGEGRAAQGELPDCAVYTLLQPGYSANFKWAVG